MGAIGPVLRREIENTFTVIRDRCNADELVILCPEPGCHDKSGNRAINLRTGKTFCWRCNKGSHNKGSFLAWANALGYRFNSSLDFSGVPMDEVLYSKDDQSSVVPVLQEVKLPAGFIPIARTPKSVYTELITEMAQRKNLDYAAFAEAGVGYTPEDPLWEPFAIFPVVEYGLTVYYQGRTYIDTPGETTKKFPSRRAIKWGAGYWIYNIDALRQQKPRTVVVVESILNVLSLKRKFAKLGWNDIVPVCVFKHSISAVQSIKLYRCKSLRELCILFDRDAIDATWKSGGGLNEKMKVTIAEMPDRADNKKLDPNDDVDAAIDAIERRKTYTSGANAAGKVINQTSKMAAKTLDLSQRSIVKNRS